MEDIQQFLIQFAQAKGMSEEQTMQFIQEFSESSLEEQQAFLAQAQPKMSGSESQQMKSGGINWSTTGYKNDSPDRYNPINYIPSNFITMEDVDEPLMLYGDGGEVVYAKPGEDYYLPNSKYVMELPIAQQGKRLRGAAKKAYEKKRALKDDQINRQASKRIIESGQDPYSDNPRSRVFTTKKAQEAARLQRESADIQRQENSARLNRYNVENSASGNNTGSRVRETAVYPENYSGNNWYKNHKGQWVQGSQNLPMRQNELAPYTGPRTQSGQNVVIPPGEGPRFRLVYPESPVDRSGDLGRNPNTGVYEGNYGQYLPQTRNGPDPQKVDITNNTALVRVPSTSAPVRAPSILDRLRGISGSLGRMAGPVAAYSSVLGDVLDAKKRQEQHYDQGLNPSGYYPDEEWANTVDEVRANRKPSRIINSSEPRVDDSYTTHSQIPDKKYSYLVKGPSGKQYGINEAANGKFYDDQDNEWVKGKTPNSFHKLAAPSKPVNSGGISVPGKFRFKAKDGKQTTSVDKAKKSAPYKTISTGSLFPTEGSDAEVLMPNQAPRPISDVALEQSDLWGTTPESVNTAPSSTRPSKVSTLNKNLFKLKPGQISGEIYNLIDAQRREPGYLQQLETDNLELERMNSTQARANLTGAYNGALAGIQDPHSQVGRGVQVQQYTNFMNALNTLNGQYDGQNTQIANQESQYNNAQQRQADQVNIGLNDQFYVRDLQARDAQREQIGSALRSISAKSLQTDQEQANYDAFQSAFTPNMGVDENGFITNDPTKVVRYIRGGQPMPDPTNQVKTQQKYGPNNELVGTTQTTTARPALATPPYRSYMGRSRNSNKWALDQ